MSAPVLAIKGIMAYLEAHQDDKLDTDIIMRACRQALEDEGEELRRIEPSDVEYAGLSPEAGESLCDLLHDTLQSHQSCPVCLRGTSK